MPNEDELADASELCLRSKAFWGYDRDFIDACRKELTLTAGDLRDANVRVATDGGKMIGVVQIVASGKRCDLEKLFVDPDAIGRGVGARLFRWAQERSRALSAEVLVVEADPGAVPFYRRMGCHDAGRVPSGSIKGRFLPQLVLRL